MISHFANFLRNDAGTAAVEYSVVMCVFAMALIGVCQTFLTTSGTQLTGTQTNLQSTALVLPSPAAGS